MFPPLSKTTYMYGLQCHKRLFLHRYHKDLANPEDEQTQAIFTAGTNAGVLAQSLFAEGVNAQGEEPFHSLKTVKQTAAFIQQKKAVIYEAAFLFNDVICAVDILVRKGEDYYAYEVKSTNGVKTQHIEDAALQYYVLNACGLNLKDFAILHFDRNYVRVGDINVSQLFTSSSVWDEVLDLQDLIPKRIADCKKVLQLKQMPNIEMGAHCQKPYACNFSEYCLSQTTPNPQEVEEAAPLDQTVTVDKEAWQNYTANFQYPLFFFDFETIQYGVPAFNFSRPYQAIPFQYSLHVQLAPNSTPLHVAFLGDGLQDPRPAMIEQMMRDLGDKGSIVTWNISFERDKIAKLAIDFPEYQESLEKIIERLVDLMPPFRPSKAIVYSDAFEGSYSIKKVLPVLVPDLNYQDLNIQEGGTASFSYGLLADMTEEERQQTRKDLLDYCYLDTLAMLRIWEAVNGLL